MTFIVNSTAGSALAIQRYCIQKPVATTIVVQMDGLSMARSDGWLKIS
jgi:hypothetical protein